MPTKFELHAAVRWELYRNKRLVPQNWRFLFALSMCWAGEKQSSHRQASGIQNNYSIKTKLTWRFVAFMVHTILTGLTAILLPVECQRIFIYFCFLNDRDKPPHSGHQFRGVLSVFLSHIQYTNSQNRRASSPRQQYINTSGNLHFWRAPIHCLSLLW